MIILGTNSIKDTGYDVANSCRFNDGSSDYMTRAFGASQTSTAAFTVSVWVKRGALGTRQSIFAAYDGSAAAGDDLEFETDDTLSYNGSGAGANTTSAKFRDVSAWYHIVVARNSGATGAANQVKIYVNGTLQTLGTNAGCNVSQFLRNGLNSRIGASQNGSAYYVDMYMAEFVAIDGQMLDHTSFGEFDADSPTIWKPKDVSGLTFGTNGFYLDFENSGSLGADVSGNGNNFTVNNLTAIDQSTDTCTNNFNTLNAVSNPPNGYTLSNGNLEATVSGQSFSRLFIANTIAPTSGKWYWESKLITSGASDRTRLGICSYEENIGTGTTFPANEVSIATGYSRIRLTVNGDGSNDGGGNTTEVDGFYTAPSANDIFMYALDLDNTKYYFGINGVWWNYNTAETGGDPTSGNGYLTNSANIIKGPMSLFINLHAGAAATTFTNQFNFGSPPYAISSGNADADGYGNFEYAVPSGYYALCTKNLGAYGG